MRAFIAVDPDETSRAALHRLIGRLSRRFGNQSVKWVDPAQLHATVAFLGDVPDEHADVIADIVRAAASDTRPFTVIAAGLGVFPSDAAPRVLWAGVTDGAVELGAVSDRIWSSLERIGLSREERPYHAHVTLGRCRFPIDSKTWHDECTRAGRMEVCRWTVSSLHLYRSILTPDGPRYEVVRTCPCAA